MKTDRQRERLGPIIWPVIDSRTNLDHWDIHFYPSLQFQLETLLASGLAYFQWELVVKTDASVAKS